MLPSTSTETLYYALVLSEEGSLTRAAERLHVSHSQISRKIKALQTAWGISLFDRTLHGFSPTEEGRVALTEIRTALEHADRGFNRARLANASHRGPLRIGLAPYIHPAIAHQLRHNPFISDRHTGVVFRTGSTPALIHKVLSGRLHLAFGVMPIVERELHIVPLREEGFCVCISERHPLKDRSRIALRDVASQPLMWLARSSQPAFYDEVVRYLMSVGFERKRLVEANNVYECLEFAADGLGCGMLPSSAADFHRGSVIIRPVTDTMLRIRTASFARRDSNPEILRSLGKVARP